MVRSAVGANAFAVFVAQRLKGNEQLQLFADDVRELDFIFSQIGDVEVLVGRTFACEIMGVSSVAAELADDLSGRASLLVVLKKMQMR